MATGVRIQGQEGIDTFWIHDQREPGDCLYLDINEKTYAMNVARVKDIKKLTVVDGLVVAAGPGYAAFPGGRRIDGPTVFTFDTTTRAFSVSCGAYQAHGVLQEGATITIPAAQVEQPA